MAGSTLYLQYFDRVFALVYNIMMVRTRQLTLTKIISWEDIFPSSQQSHNEYFYTDVNI